MSGTGVVEVHMHVGKKVLQKYVRVFGDHPLNLCCIGDTVRLTFFLIRSPGACDCHIAVRHDKGGKKRPLRVAVMALARDDVNRMTVCVLN